MMSKKTEISLLIFVMILSFLSVAAWWDWNKEKKKESAPRPAPTQSAPDKTVLPDENIPPEFLPLKKNKKEIQEQNADDTERQREEVTRIQTELKDVISRTRLLQDQVKDNRVEIQKILDRAKIHEQILKNITVPRPVPARQPMDADEIVRREKLRLIALEASKTQDQLRTIQQARTVRATQIASSKTKIPDLS